VANDRSRRENRKSPDSKRQGEQAAGQIKAAALGRRELLEAFVKAADEKDRELLLREIRKSDNREFKRIALAQKICGKYAFVSSGSDAFAAAKPEEIALEDRPR
jgi:hypothetical protein